MKKTIWALSAIAAMGLAFVACEDEEETTTTDACNNACVNTAKPYCVAANSGNHVCSARQSCDENKVFDDEGLCISGTVSGCVSDDDCDKDYVCDLTLDKPVCIPENTAQEVFSFVRIDDLSAAYIKYEQHHSSKPTEVCFGPDSGTGTPDKTNCYKDPGADIDAIALVKSGANAGTFYATSVKEYVRAIDQISMQETDISDAAVDDGIAADPRKALGEPDAFIFYGKENKDQCNLWNDAGDSRTYVSLGGVGGYIIVQMAKNIEAGDKLDVLEVGKCTYRDSSGNTQEGRLAQSEEIKVQVSTKADKDGSWKLVGTSEATETNKGILSFDITEAMLQ